jgi:2-hydroxy-3-oxopropionate reductase
METRGMRMIRHDFSPHFSADNMYKDLSSALVLAEKVGACLPAASISREMLRAVKIQGDGGMDSASVVTVIEKLANTVVKTRA